jgi:hypothetical protein
MLAFFPSATDYIPGHNANQDVRIPQIAATLSLDGTTLMEEVIRRCYVDGRKYT